MKRTLWLVPLLFAIPLLAGIPQFWEVQTHNDFRRGQVNGLSITSDGKLVLAPKFEVVFDTNEPLIFSAVADRTGNLLLGTGHTGKIYRVDLNGTGTLLADLGELDVLALALDPQNRLYAATSPDGKVYRIDPTGTSREFFDPDDKYIWSMQFDETGNLFVATGDQGVIYLVAPDGSSKVFYDSEETHITTMAIDPSGGLLAGGSPKGYIYRISDDSKPFVLYDSEMQEVRDLALSSDGTIYASIVNPIGVSLSSKMQPPMSSGGTPVVEVTVVPKPAGSGSLAESAQKRNQSTGFRSGGVRSINENVQSAILKVNPDGAVTAIWQSSSEMVLSLLLHDERLLFSTGTKGRIYNFDEPNNATLLLESTEEQVTKLISSGKRLFAASSNAGKLFEMNMQTSVTGLYESEVMNTGATSSWGKVTWKGADDGVELLTRTGNTQKPNLTWSEWSSVNPEGVVSSPNARFIQWKSVLTLGSQGSPFLSSVRVPYLQQNFRPEVTSIFMLPFGIALQKIQTPNNAVPPPGNSQSIPPRRFLKKGALSLQWTANDRNEDKLIYALQYRAENEVNWKTLEDGLEDTFYTISSDSLPDGIYVFRIVVSDEKANPSNLALVGEKETIPFAIDNSPPLVVMTNKSSQDDRVSIRIDVTDLTSTLKQAEVSIDAGDWRPIFPVDGIIDSLYEQFEFSPVKLGSGEHVIAFRIYDQNNNAGLGKTIVTMP